MKAFVIGVGRAGCRIANLLFNRGFNGVLIDTEKSDLLYLKHKYEILLGSRILDGNGAGGNLAIGEDIIETDAQNIVEKIERIKGDIDCFLVISAMGGGTGGAIAPLLEELRNGYIEPVYYVGILPSEEDDNRVLMNYYNSLKNIAKYPNAIFPVDNDMLKMKETLRGSYNDINEKVARYLATMLETGEYKHKETIGTNVVGVSEITNTLKGISSIGIGEYKINRGRGIFWKSDENLDKPQLITTMTEKAANNALIPFDIKDSQHALVVVSGPEKYLDFLGSIPARLWVDKHAKDIEIRGGDFPSKKKKKLEVMLVLSGIKKSDRISYLYQLGKALMSKDGYFENISRTLSRFRILRSKIEDVEKEVNRAYIDLHKIISKEKDGE